MTTKESRLLREDEVTPGRYVVRIGRGEETVTVEADGDGQLMVLYDEVSGTADFLGDLFTDGKATFLRRLPACMLEPSLTRKGVWCRVHLGYANEGEEECDA